MAKPLRARLATPAELFAFRRWETDLVAKANARWRELHPDEADHALIDLNGFAAALLTAMDPDLAKTTRNRSHARRYVASFFAADPQWTRESAMRLIRDIYETATRQR